MVGGTAYVVGGYDGTNWLDTVVAFTPQSGARVVAHLPTPVRYAAVGAVDGRLVIAGGSTPAARATTAIYAFDPRTAAVTRIGDLPVALDARVRGGHRATRSLVVGGQDAARATARHDRRHRPRNAPGPDRRASPRTAFRRRARSPAATGSGCSAGTTRRARSRR